MARHGRPLARAALSEAAAAGWHLRKSDGHPFGVIRCPAIGQPGACRVLVHSTSGPADGSETAKAIRKALRSCPHQPGAEPEVDELDSLTDAKIERRVEGLLGAVDGLGRRMRAAAAVEDAIERDDVTAFDEENQRLVAGDNAAQVAWAGLGRPVDPWPPAIGQEELVAEIDRLVAAVDNAEVTERLRAAVERGRR